MIRIIICILISISNLNGQRGHITGLVQSHLDACEANNVCRYLPEAKKTEWLAADPGDYIFITLAIYDTLNANVPGTSVGGEYAGASRESAGPSGQTMANNVAITPSEDRYFYAFRFDAYNSTAGNQTFKIRQGTSLSNMSLYGGDIVYNLAAATQERIYVLYKSPPAHSGNGYHSVFWPPNVNRYSFGSGTDVTKYRSGDGSNLNLGYNKKVNLEFLYTNIKP